ncbi:MAG: hypothetical protein HY909_02040 [Deltaproteobacteria bacterium]|nr:hypothetical protein [Deltaproteobacteria bacterium]
MTETWQSQSRAFAVELHVFLLSLDPSRWRAELEDAARQRLEVLAQRVREARGELLAAGTVPEERVSRVDRAFAQLEALLAQAPSLGWASASGKLSAEWEAFRKRLGAAYEELSAQLKREAVRVPPLRPTNHTRSLFHVFCGLFSLSVLLWVLTPRGRVVATLVFAGTFWFLELLRRVSPPWNDRMMAFFRHMAHDYERHRVNSSTWFASALVLLATLLSLRACAVGIAVLALGDPAAGLVGRRFGRTKLYGNKSLEGSLTFLVVGVLAALGALALGGLAPSLGTIGLFALAGALPATLAELYTSRWDDNFTIPVTAGLGVTAAELLLR